jgi:Tfp pilus assembly protein PilO
MSGRARIILTAVLVLLACVVLYLFFVRPQRQELAQIRVEIEDANNLTNQLTVELQRLQDLQANQPELEAELAKFRQFVPLRAELANFIFQVQAAANAAGLDFVNISPELPAAPPEGAALAQVRSQIGAAGGYFALQDFVRRIYNMDRAMRVDNFALSVGSTEPFGTRLRMDMSVRMFYELPEPAAVTTTTTPGATPAPTTTP